MLKNHGVGANASNALSVNKGKSRTRRHTGEIEWSTPEVNCGLVPSSLLVAANRHSDVEHRLLQTRMDIPSPGGFIPVELLAWTPTMVDVFRKIASATLGKDISVEGRWAY